MQFTIFGNLASKSNSRKLVTIGGKPAFIKSDRARSFESTAYVQIPSKFKLGLEEPLILTARIYYDSRRPDLDVSLLQDILEKAGVYKNDRQIVELHLFKYLDKVRPRVEIEIRKAL